MNLPTGFLRNLVPSLRNRTQPTTKEPYPPDIEPDHPEAETLPAYRLPNDDDYQDLQYPPPQAAYELSQALVHAREEDQSLPRPSRRVPRRYVIATAAVCAALLAGAAIAVVTHDSPEPDAFAEQLIFHDPEPTETPPAAAPTPAVSPPAATARTPIELSPESPTPPASIPPAAGPEAVTTPEPSATPPPQASPLPIDEVLVHAYASCAGIHRGTEYQKRRLAALSTLERGYRKREDFALLIDENCPGAIARAIAKPLPTATPRPTPYAGPPTPTPLPERVAAHPVPTVPYEESTNSTWLLQTNPSLSAAITDHYWVSDGLDPTERTIVEQMAFIAALGHHEYAAALNSMPFLDHPDAADANALLSLARISNGVPHHLPTVMDHPTISRGITDEWTPVVATLYIMAVYDPSLIPIHLDPYRVHVEDLTHQLSSTRSVRVSVIRDTSRSTGTAQILATAIKSVEHVMNHPFPNQHVAVLIADLSPTNRSGLYYRSGITLSAQFDRLDAARRQSRTPQALASTLAGYYWNGNQPWLDSGLSDTIAALAEYQRSRRSFEASVPPCTAHRSIQAMEQNSAHLDPLRNECPTALGQRLFIDLIHELGDPVFRDRISKLYRQTTYDPNMRAGITDVRNLFDEFPSANAVIDRWYTNEVPFRDDRIDKNPAVWTLPSPKATLTHAGITIEPTERQPHRVFVTEEHIPYILAFTANTRPPQVQLTIQFKTHGTAQQSVPFSITTHYEDGHLVSAHETVRTLTPTTRTTVWTTFFPIGRVYHDWPTGAFHTNLWSGDQKVAQIAWRVTP